ncbi:MAG: type VI secretion system baseplate subunit TssE [Sandaracinaceae bacterium]
MAAPQKQTGRPSGPRGLLSRLARGERRTDPVGAVLAHLRVLLNARRGGSATVPDYGLLDLHDVVHDLPAALATLQRHIRTTIVRYEPRLGSVAVRSAPSEDPLTLRFDVVARLAGTDRQVVRLRTSVTADRRLVVE